MYRHCGAAGSWALAKSVFEVRFRLAKDPQGEGGNTTEHHIIQVPAVIPMLKIASIFCSTQIFSIIKCCPTGIKFEAIEVKRENTGGWKSPGILESLPASAAETTS
jgi:hypothetical protein